MIPLGLLSKILPFLKGLNWTRILLVGGLAVSIFFLGAFWSDKKHAEHEADFEKAKAVAIAERERELNEEWKVRLKEEEDARLALANSFNIIVERKNARIKEIENTRLTKPLDGVIVEGCLESEDETTKVILANPISLDFIRLWNNGQSGSP